jgi:hypothetical protein
MSRAVLTLTSAAVWKEDIIAAMLSHPPTAQAGFTTRDVEGHGQAAAYDSSVEQVRGHALAVEIVVVAAEADLRELLGALAPEFAGRGISWRIAAVAASGRLD